MSRNAKIVIAVVLIVIVVVVLCCTLGGKKEDTNTTNETSVNNIAEENIVEENEVGTNTIENEVENEVDEEPIIENVTELEPQGSVYETNSDIGTTDKKQQAINLVKEKWGEDDTVTFRCDSVNSKGEYVIAVVSKETATVKNYFKVNLNTKLVEIDY
ncbi:MAG: hypothetical protein IJW20_05280 [Clostridia bacterium]|nr:hypothetical protein [Clostridia bacterium]